MMEPNLFQKDLLERQKALTKLLSRENETYAKIHLLNERREKQIVYVKGTWYPTHFIVSALDGQDTWDFNATEEFVANEASKLQMEAEEYLDQVHTYFCHQDVESNYSFEYVSPNTKMLQCSYFDETLDELQSIKLMLHKISNCGEVAYQMLGLLVDTNTKQQEELARKTRDIQRMAAEIHELRFNPEKHFRLEHDPLEPLQHNRMSTNQRFEVENVNEQFLINNEHHEEQSSHNKNLDSTNTINNTQYWTYDTTEENLHPILRPLTDHQHIDDLNIQNQQPYHFHKSISNHQDLNDNSHLEGGESSSIEPLEDLNNKNYNISLHTNQKHELHHFSYVVPCHYVEGLLESYNQNDTELQTKNDQANMYLYIAPKKIVIEKKIIVEIDLEEKSPTLYKQNIKLNKANWSLNLPTLDNEIFYNDQNTSNMIAESFQNENNDLSIKLEIIDQMSKLDDLTNNIDEIQQHLSFDDTPIKHESIVQQNKTNNIDDQTHSKVFFHHTTQDEKKGKVYYKTPKHSCTGSKIGANGYDNEEEELNYETSNNVSKSRSYAISNYNKNNNYSRNLRWSSPSQLTRHDDNFDSKAESSFVGNQQDEETNTSTIERLYTHCQNDVLEDQFDTNDSRISHVHWGPNSSSDKVQIPTNIMVPNTESFNKTNNRYESDFESESDTNLSVENHPVEYHHVESHPIENHHVENHPIQNHHEENYHIENHPVEYHDVENHPIHSILHHLGKQHPHNEHINWGENSVSDKPRKLQNIHESITEVKPSHIYHVQESLQHDISVDKEQLSTEKETTNYYKGEADSQESNEVPLLNDKVLSFQSSPNESIPENTSQNVLKDESIEKQTNVSLELKSTKDKTSSENSNEIVTKSTKKIVHQNKSARFSKSPSLLQSFFSLFQSSPNNLHENSHQNENEIQSNEETNQKNNVNELSTQSETELKNSQNDDKVEDVSIVSTIFSSFHEPESLRPSIAQSHIEGGNESLALNSSSKENETQDENVINPRFENESIDEEKYFNELPHQKMDASRKASVDEVRKELFLKLGNQQEQELEGTPPLDNSINNTIGHKPEHAMVRLENNELVGEGIFNKISENNKGKTSHVDHEPRQYSIDKIDSNNLKDMQQRSQSASISRTSLYSSFRDRPSKSTVNPKFSRSNESISNIHQIKESTDKKDVQESQIRVDDDQSSIIHSQQTPFDNNDNKEETTSYVQNNNESMTNAFNDKVFKSLMPSISQTPTTSNNENQSGRSSTLSTNNDNDPDKSVLCVARIRFVFPGKSTISQNHATTSTSSTPNRSDFNIGLKFNNEKSQD